MTPESDLAARVHALIADVEKVYAELQQHDQQPWLSPVIRRTRGIGRELVALEAALAAALAPEDLR